MGRKRIPKTQRREVISISLKPSTIALIDEQISEDTPRSQFIERAVLEYLKSYFQQGYVDETPYYIQSQFDCLECEKTYRSKRILKEMYCKGCQSFVPLSRQLKVEL